MERTHAHSTLETKSKPIGLGLPPFTGSHTSSRYGPRQRRTGMDANAGFMRPRSSRDCTSGRPPIRTPARRPVTWSRPRCRQLAQIAAARLDQLFLGILAHPSLNGADPGA